MNIGFFGTPELAARVLDGLAQAHRVIFAVTAEDKRAGRNRELQFCPAKSEAIRLGIPVLQPASLKEPSFLDGIGAFEADAFVVVAYGSLIPRSVFDRPRFGTLNLHPSLLPLYRGAAPIQWCLINGETETGITVQLINEKLDAGDIVVQEKVPVEPDTTAGDLLEMASASGAGLIGRALDLLASGAAPVRQDDSRATYCGKIDRDTAIIDWNKRPLEIHNLVRGLNPKPVAFSHFRGEQVRIWKTAPVYGEAPDGAAPGVLVRLHKKRLLAGTGDGFIEVLELQPANKKVMDAGAFINGYRLAPEDRFE
jgi:methionyl-tRNA formyltransferase